MTYIQAVLWLAAFSCRPIVPLSLVNSAELTIMCHVMVASSAYVRSWSGKVLGRLHTLPFLPAI
jgi:hypothetical protein